MKKTVLAILSQLLVGFLTSCSGWVIPPGTAPTPFLPPTNTPSILTATPVVIAASPTSTVTIPTATAIQFITATSMPTLIPSHTPITADPPTFMPNGPAVSVEILGCDTSIDVTHGMGEVTNAFVVVRNTGSVQLDNVNTTLYALDEGRVHPDKTVEIPLLVPDYKVTLKLTVDSTYQADTPIQIEVTADGGLFQRLGAESCRDIGLFAPNPADLITPMPDNP
jgi:hypothetical protein